MPVREALGERRRVPTIVSAMLAAASMPAPCAAYVVHASATERDADASLVTLATGHAARPGGIGLVLAMRDVRIVRATIAYSEPAAFILRGAGAMRLAGVWFHGKGSRRSAYAWARVRVGLSPDAARCLAELSVVPG